MVNDGEFEVRREIREFMCVTNGVGHQYNQNMSGEEESRICSAFLRNSSGRSGSSSSSNSHLEPVPTSE